MLGDGGFLTKITSTAKLGFGATLGKGQNIITFVHINDLCRAIEFLIKNSSNDTYNLTGFSCSQKEITKSVCDTYDKKLRFYMPNFIVKILFGQMGKELLLSSQNIYAKRLKNLCFEFKFDKTEKAIKNILEKN